MDNSPIKQSLIKARVGRRRLGTPLLKAIVGILTCALAGVAWADDMERCLLEESAKASDQMTIGEVRSICQAKEADQLIAEEPPEENPTPVQMRLESEYDTMGRNFVITTHKPNYILYTHNSKTNQSIIEDISGTEEPLDDEEMKVQISMKFPLARDVIWPNNDIFFAFTGTAWWQLFNDEFSEPFRETNYEPEIFWRHYGGPKILGLKMAGWDLGLNHESNGRGFTDLSRSWNRVLGQVVFDADSLSLLLRAWYRIPADDDEDDNPQMHRYYGYGDIRTIWAPNRNTFTAMFRPGTEKNAFELTWSYPITKVLRVYAQYFNGYGESLIDYDVRTERIGIGIALNDFVERRN
jgi:phospholipase A1